jgi:hypothetical protein
MLTTLVASCALIFCAGGACAALLDLNRREREATARDVWRATTMRNGVTTESPFSELTATINEPGLVEVHPRSRPQPPTPPAPLSNAPVPAACPLEPSPTEGRKPVESSEESLKAQSKKDTPFKWGYPKGGFNPEFPEIEAITALHQLIDDGERRKTVLSWAVFGANGGTVYSTAKPIIEEALSNAD